MQQQYNAYQPMDGSGPQVPQITQMVLPQLVALLQARLNNFGAANPAQGMQLNPMSMYRTTPAWTGMFGNAVNGGMPVINPAMIAAAQARQQLIGSLAPQQPMQLPGAPGAGPTLNPATPMGGALTPAGPVTVPNFPGTIGHVPAPPEGPVNYGPGDAGGFNLGPMGSGPRPQQINPAMTQNLHPNAQFHLPSAMAGIGTNIAPYQMPTNPAGDARYGYMASRLGIY